MRRHYAPRARVILVEAGSGEHEVRALVRGGGTVGWMPLSNPVDIKSAQLLTERMPDSPQAYSARIYAVLHALDDAGVAQIVIEMPPDRPEGLAARDRLRRAASTE
jgi:L-threonylcarbamoyladenylate synthase